MKKHLKAILGLLAGFAIIIGVFAFFIQNNNLDEDVNKEVSSAVSELNDKIGSTSKKFVVLDIVPNLSQAEIGYLVSGQEPVDIMKACAEGNAAVIQEFSDDGVKLVSEIDEDTYNTLVQKYGKSKMEKYWEKTQEIKPTATPNVTPEPTQEPNQEVSQTDVRVLAAPGSSNTYQLKSGNKFAYNKDKLTSALGSIIAEEKEVMVVTVTSKQLNDASIGDVESLIKNADLIYASQTSHLGSKQKEIYNAYGETDSNANDSFLDNGDIAWDVAEVIFKQVADKKNPKAIILDSSIYYKALDASSKKVTTYQYKLNRAVKYNATWNTAQLLIKQDSYVAGSNKAASNNNMYKLYLMCMFRDQAEFYNLFVESGMINSTGSYKLQSGDAATYWNTYTFLPCKGEKAEDEPDKAIGTEEYWANEMGIVTSPTGNAKVMVQGSAYSIDSSTALTKELTNNIYTQGSYTYLKHVFESAGTSNLSPADVIKYIYNYKPKKTLSMNTYKVLEIQPSNTFALHEADIERLLPYTAYFTPGESGLKLTITKMTTAQFIGDIEDINSNYDMIYIGNDIGGMYQKSGKTYYGDNNSDMTGVIYAHVGGKVKYLNGDPDSNRSALFTGSQEPARYSGNDITETKKAALEEFIASGFPVIVADGLVNNVNSSGSYFNDKSNNNMYNFIRENQDGLLSIDLNYRALPTEEADKKLAILTKSKPVLNITTKPVNFNANDPSSVITFESTSDDRRITYKFNVTDVDNPGAAYYVNLYVDRNADGLFKTSEKLATKKIRADGNSNSLTFSLNTNYTGVFTWKLEVKKVGASALRASEVGYSCIRFSDVEVKQTVTVLQVQSVKGNPSNDRCGDKHSTEWGYETAHNVNLETSPKFQTLFSQLKDYDIKIKAIDLQQFCYDGWYDSNVGSKKLRYTDIEASYDMLIFGFADSYRDMELHEKDRAAAVKSFIDSGKSVLFTHDLTSQVNNTSIMGETPRGYQGSYMETTNGKGFNKYLRDAMGLNRFKQSVAVNNEYSSSVYDKNSLGEKYAFTYTALMQYSNYKYAGTGQSNSGLYGPYKGLMVNLSSDKPYWPDINKGYAADKVTNVNNGQITKYPYDIPSLESSGKLEVATTHGQYYQLNMEDEDIVVWYCLSDSSSNGWYSTSPNDVSNNYYIYNKGNVTYSGVGHSNDGSMGDAERKLFVNTIVAALRAGVVGPTATISNGYRVSDETGDCYYLYADVDADSPDADFQGTEPVEFYATDDSPKAGEYLYVALEVEKERNPSTGEIVSYESKIGEYKILDSSGNELPKQTITRTIGAKTETIEVVKVKRSDSENAEKQYIYTIKYPKGVLKDASTSEFKISVYNDKKAKGYTNGVLMRRALFKLD